MVGEDVIYIYFHIWYFHCFFTFVSRPTHELVAHCRAPKAGADAATSHATIRGLGSRIGTVYYVKVI